MNRCVGCDNVERSLDADLLCSWCVERRECFHMGEHAGRAAMAADILAMVDATAKEAADCGDAEGLRQARRWERSIRALVKR